MKIYKHQLDIITEDKPKTGLFLGTGSGKTLVALSLARGKTLVICPKTQREDRNWEREAQKNNIKIDLTVVSKEQFRTMAHAMKKFDTVIVDEAHTCLGVSPSVKWVKKRPMPKTSQLFEALEAFIARTNPSRLYLCTATIIRSPMTVWGAGKLLGKDWDFYKFRDRFYFQLPMPGRQVFAPKTDDETKEALADLVRKIGYVGRLEDYFDVPDQTYRTIHVDLTVKQKARIKEMALEFPDPLVRVGKIHQIENGTLSGDEFTESQAFENEKIERLLELAIEFPRMIIFAKYTAQVFQIASEFQKIKKKVFVMTGQVSDRGDLINSAKNCDDYVFIVQAQISAGWELPECPVMVFASRTYSFVDYDQALGRIQRANNIKKNLYINLVVKGGVDEAVDKCISQKQDFNEKLYITSA